MIQWDQCHCLTSISKQDHLFVSLYLIWVVQENPSQQGWPRCVTDDSKKVSKDVFLFLSAKPAISRQLTMGVQAERRSRCTTVWSSKTPKKEKRDQNPAFLFPTVLRYVSVKEEESQRNRFSGSSVLYGSTRLSLNPKPENEIRRIKMFLSSSSRIWWTDFTVKAGKLRRCCVREAQQEFNPNAFSSWLLAQISLLIYWMGPFLFLLYVWFYCGFQKYL